jgi:hypothetical protein
MRNLKFLPILAGAASIFLAASNLPVEAGTINIGNGATGSNPTGTSGPGDPNLIGTGSDISIEVQGSASITNQVLLTILIPNDTTDLFGGTNPLGTITTYPSFPDTSPTGTGSSAFTGTGFGLGSGTGTYQGNGFWGDFTAAPGSPKLADFLDSNFNSSNNGPNFVVLTPALVCPA